MKHSENPNTSLPQNTPDSRDFHGSVEARIVRVTGLVQGVGFRPTVYRIAAALNLAGRVWNDEAGVGIRLEGDASSLDAFPDTLLAEKPPLARIDSIETTQALPEGLEGFSISETHAGGRVTASITADAGTCDACFEDMFASSNRRYRYPFTNCTHCGPRFTITRRLPYDRPQTSMAKFPMCPACLKEYEDPSDRRFHAQPNACPACGPELKLLLPTGEPAELLPEDAGDPVRAVVRALKAGLTVALKGLGGFHLACDARNAEAVARLRSRKHRDEKPLAVMGASVEALEKYVVFTPEEKTLLISPARPIVLARKRTAEGMSEGAQETNALKDTLTDAEFDARLEGVAPGLTDIGVMLPYTPLHAMIFHTFAGEPEGTAWMHDASVEELLVMTSANPVGEPLVTQNDEAVERLGSMADFILVHNRDILLRCDDSVVRVADEKPLFIRRSRGFVPEGIKTGVRDLPCVLALGPYLKSTCAISRGDEIVLSQHIGDLENRSTERALEEAVEHLESILDARPEAVACDLHPDFFSTRFAQELAAERNLPLIRVPHHAAHVGAVMAEAGLTGKTPVLGLALDGVGLGPVLEGGDSADVTSIWGGELLLAGATGFERLGTLRSLPLPGGDRAAREPWRMGAAVLTELGREAEIARRFAGHVTPQRAEILVQLIRNPRLTKHTTSTGRWFDAAASLLAGVAVQHDEATAAMRLESLAARSKASIADSELDALVRVADRGVLDLLPLMDRLLDGRDRGESPEDGALLFHLALVRGLVRWVGEIRAACTDTPMDPTHVVLSGGCFANRFLAAGVVRGLEALGLEGLLPRKAPAGDGGVAAGQAWLASRILEEAKATGLPPADYAFRADRTLGAP